MKSTDEDMQELEDDAIGLGCALEHFSDYEEVCAMIDNLKTMDRERKGTVERAHEKFIEIFKQYKEQPHLLDKHLDRILEKLIALVRDNGCDMNVKHEAFKYLGVITTVRGYKILIRHLPHEVADFEPVLKMIEQQDPNDVHTWMTRYMLLLWMSIIVIIPFHMSRLDGFNPETENFKSSMQRVFEVCKLYAIQSDSCSSAAAYLISKFLTRSDVKEKYLNEFLDWSYKLTSNERSGFEKYGILPSVSMILKHAKREDVLPHSQKLLSWIINEEFRNYPGSNIQKLVYKIIQRIGLILLPPKLAKWRYQRGNRSLAANLSSGDSFVMNNASIKEETNKVEKEEENIDVPEEIEEIIDQLLQGLRSSENCVRWSAAKGIGRVTGRLPKELADEVVGSVLELLNPRENDGAWHGGCLTLAELGRRGLLLPSRLPEVVPAVLKALVYDEPRGYSSVGSHVRDAACYVCWSFARAYETVDLKPFVNDIAAHLLVVTCFDREINCRRAASAAFQENVGRQGTFPHGIDILTTADFFAVSLRNNSYLSISVFIGQFEEYVGVMIQHLLDRKVVHWDIAIRELTAKALHNLTPLAVDFMVTKALPDLFEKTASIDLNYRHGSVLALGEIFHALSSISKEKPIGSIVSDRQLEQARDLIPSFRQKSYFRGLGGELLKQSCCNYIQKCSLARMPYHSDPVTHDWLELINECLSYKVQNVRLLAIEALPALLTEYYSSDKRMQCELIDRYVKEACGENLIECRMGYSLALGNVPNFILEEHAQKILDALAKCSRVSANTLNWAESRRDALKALTGIITKGDAFSDEHVSMVYNCFFDGLKDYTKDNRGDVGAFVRDASIIGLQSVTMKLCAHRKHVFNVQLVEEILVNVAQQAVERIDRTRALAAQVFYHLITNPDLSAYVPHREELLKIFDKEICDNIVWNSATATFPLFVKLLRMPKYTYNILLGFICTIGGQTETLSKHSSESFFNYLNNASESKDDDEIIRICGTVLEIFRNFQKNDRITVSLLKFLEKLFIADSFHVILEDENAEFAKEILKLTREELFGCTDIYKLIDGVKFLCQYIQIKHEVSKGALVQLSILLCHRHAYIRKATSINLFEAVVVFGDSSLIPFENLDEIQTLLSTTNWEEPVVKVKPIRNQLCALMGIKVPISLKKTN